MEFGFILLGFFPTLFSVTLPLHLLRQPGHHQGAGPAERVDPGGRLPPSFTRIQLRAAPPRPSSSALFGLCTAPVGLGGAFPLGKRFAGPLFPRAHCIRAVSPCREDEEPPGGWLPPSCPRWSGRHTLLSCHRRTGCVRAPCHPSPALRESACFPSLGWEDLNTEGTPFLSDIMERLVTCGRAWHRIPIFKGVLKIGYHSSC